jgi:hypothetical protein
MEETPLRGYVRDNSSGKRIAGGVFSFHPCTTQNEQVYAMHFFSAPEIPKSLFSA